MKIHREYCSTKLTKLLVEKFDYPKNKLHWVKFSVFNYKRLAKLYEIQTWLRDEHDYHILVRHPRGFTGDGMEFWKWTYEIIIKNPEKYIWNFLLLYIIISIIRIIIINCHNKTFFFPNQY